VASEARHAQNQDRTQRAIIPDKSSLNMNFL
jgi:hypothetical protein